MGYRQEHQFLDYIAKNRFSLRLAVVALAQVLPYWSATLPVSDVRGTTYRGLGKNGMEALNRVLGFFILMIAVHLLTSLKTAMKTQSPLPKKVTWSSRWHWLWSGLKGLAVLLVLYGLLSYVTLPALWRHYEHHPALQSAPKTTQTAEGIAGDPLNVGLVGTQSEVVHALLAIHWDPADPITWRTSLGIAASVLLDRPDPTAPVSSLYLWGRRQDLAFELPVGKSAKQRHHVRLWRSDELGVDGRPLWLGAATFDSSVEFNHRTGQITHRIAPDVDAQRDQLMQELKQAGQLKKLYQVTGVGATLQGRNGAGDWYYTDGELTVGVIRVDQAVQSRPPTQLPNPVAVELKNLAWSWLRRFLSTLMIARDPSGFGDFSDGFRTQAPAPDTEAAKATPR